MLFPWLLSTPLRYRALTLRNPLDSAPLRTILLRPTLFPMTLSQYRSSPLLKSLNHHPRHFGRRSLAQRAVHRTREPHLHHQIDLRPRQARRACALFLRRLPIRRGRLKRKLLEHPPRQQRRENRPVPRRLLRIPLLLLLIASPVLSLVVIMR